MFDPQQRIHEMNQMEHGTARLDLIAQAVKEADDENQHYWRLYFRYQYIKESTMHDDNFKGLLCFPEYLRIFDEHPELQDDMYQDMMWEFKWLIGNLDDYYQISLDEVNHYFEEFKKRSQQYGFSLRTYYMKLTTFWLDVNPELAFTYYEQFLKYPRNRNSDCEACELNYTMRVLLAQNKEQEALEVIQPVLQHEKRCAEIPHVTYAHLAKYYFQQEKFSEAAYYANLCENLIRNKSEFLREIGTLLEIYSVMDINAGWKLFKYSLELFMNCHNPVMRLCFARGAYRLMQAVSEQMEFVKSPLLSVLPLTHSSEGWSSEAVKQHFYEIAREISQKLDERNQIAYYIPLLEEKLPEYDEEKAFEENMKSVHGLVHKAQTMITIFSDKKISMDELEQTIQHSGIEMLSNSRDENSYYLSLKAGENALECILAPDVDTPPVEVRFIQGMEKEQIQELLASECCCILAVELTGNPQETYQLIMHFLKKVFPDMKGIINLTAQKAYPAEWVKFAGTYQNAVSPHDLYSIYLSGDEESGEVWGSTIGLNALGMRELEFINANTENFGAFAGILDKTAAFCTERNSLPDEKGVITYCWKENKGLPLFWTKPETALKEAIPEGIAVSMTRETPTGILNLHHLEDIEMLECRNSRNEMYRKLDLAEETFSIFQNALQKPFEKALVRFRIELNEEMQEEYDYEIELLWAEVSPDGKTAVFLQESEAVPEYHEGDSLEITSENTADWRIQPIGFDGMISPEEAYLLQEASA